MEWQITNGILILENEIVETSGLTISDGRVQSLLTPGSESSDRISLNLHGLAVYPALINAHDTLIASYRAASTPSAPYSDWIAWDNELKGSPEFKERMLLDAEQLYRLGSYKNIIGGSVFVVDHIPHFVREPFLGRMPVDMLDDFGIAHSISSYSLQWGEGIASEYAKAVDNNLPFITHIAEGFDRDSKESLQMLDRYEALGSHTVLVHGLSLSEWDLDRIADTGAHLVWCPTMCQLLYGAQPPIQAALQRGIPISLGTDACMTGSTGMLSELSAAGEIYSREYEEELPSTTLLEMATTNPASAFRIEDRGSLLEGSMADILILKSVGSVTNPIKAMGSASQRDIFLLTRKGVPVLGDPSLEPIFSELNVNFDRISVQGSEKLVIEGLIKTVESIYERVENDRPFPFLFNETSP